MPLSSENAKKMPNLKQMHKKPRNLSRFFYKLMKNKAVDIFGGAW